MSSAVNTVINIKDGTSTVLNTIRLQPGKWILIANCVVNGNANLSGLPYKFRFQDCTLSCSVMGSIPGDSRGNHTPLIGYANFSTENTAKLIIEFWGGNTDTYTLTNNVLFAFRIK